MMKHIWCSTEPVARRWVGEDYFFLNEYLDEGKTLFDFDTLYEYDYDDHCFQQ